MKNNWLIRISLTALLGMTIVGCGSNDFDGNRPAPLADPTSPEEALAVLDENYDYAEAFANSGRGGF